MVGNSGTTTFQMMNEVEFHTEGLWNVMEKERIFVEEISHEHKEFMIQSITRYIIEVWQGKKGFFKR